MPIITVILVIVVVGVLLWLINAYIPMEAMIKRILNIVVIVFLVIWLLKVFGLWAYLMQAHI
jgi:hypothetical protein